jgi:polygalacturonase
VARKGGGLLTLGSETSGGIRHVLATDLTGKGTGNGFHIKSATTRGGTVEDIYFEHIKMDSVGTAFQFTMNWNPSYSYSTLPAGYNIDSVPAHWKVMLTKVEPPEKGTPHFKNIFVSDIKAEGVKKIVNAAGLKTSALQDFHFNNVQISGADAGDISFANNWEFKMVTFTAANSKPLRVADSENMHLNGQ